MNNDLLPPNATAFEKHLAKVSSRISTIDVTPVDDLWNADTCPVALLPWLAWAEHVPEWSSHWQETVQRSAIKAARAIRRKRGTAGAVIDSLKSLGLGVQLQEWFEQVPIGTAGTFKLNVELSDRGLSRDEQASIERAVNYVKNVRSHWDVMNIFITEHGHRYYGATLQSGDETIVYPLIITQLAQSLPLNFAMTLYDVETTTINPLI